MKLLFSDYEFDPVTLELRRHGEIVHLPRLPATLLAYFAMNPNRLIPKDELFREVWSDTIVGDASIMSAIRHIRRTLDRDSEASIIETRRGLGYRLRVSIAEVPASVADRAPPPSQIEPSQRSATPGSTPTLEPANPAAVDYEDLLLGRHAEKRLVRGALRRVRNGRARVVLLEGGAGIGKTTFLEWCAAEIRRQGLEPLLVRCRQDRGAPPLLAFVHLMEQLRRPDTYAMESVNEPLASLLDRVFPPTGVTPTPPMPEPSRDLDALRFSAYATLATLLRRISTRSPLALLFDDIHLADEPAANLMDFVAAHLVDSRVLILGTLRPDPNTTEAIARLARNPRAVTSSLTPLTLADTRLMVEAYRGTPCESDVAGQLFRQTGGNPFFLRQMIPAMMSSPHRVMGDVGPGIPQSIRNAVGQACATLSERSHDALSAASVLGASFSARSLANLLEWPLEDVLECLDEPLQRGMLGIDAQGPIGSFRFTQTIVRDALYHQLGARERARVHRAATRTSEGAAAARQREEEAAVAHPDEAHRPRIGQTTRSGHHRPRQAPATTPTR